MKRNKSYSRPIDPNTNDSRRPRAHIHIYTCPFNLMQPDAPDAHIYIYIYRGGASGAALVCIFFSLNARLRSTRPKNLMDRQEFFSLNARLRSTRPKNLMDRQDGSAVQGRWASGAECIYPFL
jgi:hypothetical protein